MVNIIQLRYALRWIARAILVGCFALVILRTVDIDDLSSLLVWYVLAVAVALVVAWNWELAGGIGLTMVCLSLLLYALYLQWGKYGFAADALIGCFLVTFGSIYALIAYASMLIPGVLLVLSWYAHRSRHKPGQTPDSA